MHRSMTKKIGCPDPKCYKTHYDVKEARACAKRMTERVSLADILKKLNDQRSQGRRPWGFGPATNALRVAMTLVVEEAPSFGKRAFAPKTTIMPTHFSDPSRQSSDSLCGAEGTRNLSATETDVTCPACIKRLSAYKAFGVIETQMQLRKP